MTHAARHRVVIVGGGHNGLINAAYLARAGISYGNVTAPAGTPAS